MGGEGDVGQWEMREEVERRGKREVRRRWRRWR